jgi:hypothetical protein
LYDTPLLLESPNSTADAFPDPTIDPFYAEDVDELQSASPGQILRTRQVSTEFKRNVASVNQLYYRTTSTTRQAQGTVATVWKPKKPKRPAQILSFHIYGDSASPNCNPSWALIPGTPSHGKIPVSLDSAVYIQWALDQGIYVVVPDHLGSRAAWLAGYQSGAAVLDGIRATRSHYGLSEGAEVVLLGYSGGAHATVWASNMASMYAPDVNIIGAISGGTIFDTKSAFQYIDGTILSGFAGAGLVGLMNAHPDLEEYVMNNMDEEGITKLQMYRNVDMCIPEVFITNPFTNFTNHFINSDPLNHPVIHRIMSQETLFKDLASFEIVSPSYPRLIWHAELDEVVPFDGAKQFVKEQCGINSKANIHFQSIPLTEHISALVLGVPGVVEFMRKIFTHSTPNVPCGTGDSSFTTLLSPRARTILGKEAFNFLIALHGQSLVGTTLKLILPL